MATWTGKTRGNLLGYRIFVWLIRNFSLRFAYFLLKIVSLYFNFFAADTKKHLQYFYLEILGYSKKEAAKLVKQNFFLLAQSIVDKMAFAMGKGKEITFTNHGEQWLKDIADLKKGGFFISAHLSNWEIAGQILKDIDVKINVVMLENEHEMIKQYLEKQQSLPKYNVIAQKEDMSHLIKIYQAIKKGEIVCMLADRYVQKNATFEIDFFGRSALFPAGPFQLIEKLKVPYTFVFTAKTSMANYHFTSTEPKIPNSKAENIANDFVRLLEEKVRKYPEQWFNYHDFYQK